MKGRRIITAMMVLLCAYSYPLQAQYEEMLKPQTTNEMLRIKQAHMRSCDIYMLYNGQESPYGGSQYDTGGRIIKINTPKIRGTYAYDAKGRLKAWVDSAYDGRRFLVSVYGFNYLDNGRFSGVKMPEYTSIFSYDDAKRQAVEEMSGKQTGKTLYSFNEAGKVSNVEMRSAEGRLLKRKKKLYNAYGDLASEIEVTYNTNGTRDSNTAIYTYDAKGRLLRKQLSFNTVEDGTETADESSAVPEASGAVTLVKSRTDIYNYTYDRLDNVATETLTSSDTRLNGKKEWVYSNTGLLQRYNRYDAANKLVECYTYRFR